MTRIRMVGVAFAVLQVATYYRPHPPGTRGVAFGLAGFLFAGALTLEMRRRRTTTLDDARRVALYGLALDIAVVMGFVFIYTFDPDTAIWALIYILPLEGAIHFQFRGAIATMAAAAALYAGRELYGAAVFETPFLATSLSFRMGIGFLIAAVAGSTAAGLVRERRALEVANSELGEVNAALRDLMAVASHDIRAPLSAIRGSAATLAARWTDLRDEDKLELAHIIERRSDLVARLVEDLLTITSIEAGAMTTRPAPIALSDVVHEVMGSMSPRLSHVRVLIPEGTAVEADPDHVDRIVANLLTNATRHGAPPFVVHAERRDDRVTLRIEDFGDGVSEAFVPHLFAKFSRDPGTRGGTGLGLSIVRGLAEVNGGTVWYEPNRPRGSRFVVELPAGSVPARVAAP